VKDAKWIARCTIRGREWETEPTTFTEANAQGLVHMRDTGHDVTLTDGTVTQFPGQRIPGGNRVPRKPEDDH
jgi:hypothetical protein